MFCQDAAGVRGFGVLMFGPWVSKYVKLGVNEIQEGFMGINFGCLGFTEVLYSKP